MPTRAKGAETTIEELVERAKRGNRDVLEEIIRRIQDRIYGLALRMLFIPADAEDATQEILVKVITHLGTFKGESRFETWVYSIASNHLLTTRKCRAERWQLTFDACAQTIEEGAPGTADDASTGAERNLIVEETKLACVQYLLLCLKREVRLAVILGEIFGVKSIEGARILGLTPAAYRQRLSRGKRQLRDFLVANCGLVDPRNPCSCSALAAVHLKKRQIDPRNLLFVTHPRRSRPEEKRPEELLEELDQISRAAMLIRTHPDYAAPGVFVESMKGMIDSGRFRLLGRRRDERMPRSPK
jgi:RNA polymerase sigma factor (sigma-70 family)